MGWLTNFDQTLFEIISNAGHNKLVIERNWRMVHLLLMNGSRALICSMVNLGRL